LKTILQNIKLQKVKKFIVGVILFGFSSIITFNSCDTNNQKESSTAATNLSAINRDPSLTIFSIIANYSGDDNYVNNCNTIIAPVDSAFINAGITARVAANLGPVKCDSIMMYYTILDGIQFNTASEKEIGFSSGLGPNLFADSTNTALYFDGIEAVSTTPVHVGKSSIYKLKQFINVPAGTVTEIVASDTSLRMFNEALRRTNFLATLSDGTYTLFMPTNDAFKKAGYADIKSIDRENINTITQILLSQTVPNNYFENDLNKQTSLKTLQGESIMVKTKGNFKMIKNSHPNTSATLLNNGMLADNVLTYKTNNLLLP
jgi:uncharacterized surface protein with fasciclin (FAS1) repeats